MIGNFLDNFDKLPLMLKLLWQLFGQLLENFGLLFNLTSGHTDHEWLKWAMPDCKTYFCRKVNFFTMTMTPIIKMTNFFIFEFPVQLKNWNLNIWIFIIQIKVFLIICCWPWNIGIGKSKIVSKLFEPSASVTIFGKIAHFGKI